MKVMIIGCGGGGGYLALPLIRYMNALPYLTNLIFVDGDRFETKNFDRQVCTNHSMGMNKAEYLMGLCKHFLPKAPTVNLSYVDKYITPNNLDLLNADVVFSCVDNHQTRKLIDEYCRVNNIVVINGGNEYIDGNVQVVTDQTKTLCDTHPEVLNPKDKNPGLDCTALAESTPQISVVNNLGAALMLMQFHRLVTNKFSNNHEVFFDVDKGLLVSYDRFKNDAKKEKKTKAKTI